MTAQQSGTDQQIGESSIGDGSTKHSGDAGGEKTAEVPEDAATAGAGDDGPTELTKNDLFHVLQNERRRQVLQYMVENRPGPFEMRTIAEHVAAWEHDTTLQALTSDERQRVYIALYQIHLPKLDEHGLIDYNQSRGIVEMRPLIDQTLEHLSIPAEDATAADGADESVDEPSAPRAETEPNWVRLFGGATVVSLLVVGSAWANALPVSLSGFSVATIVVAIFAVLTVWMVARTGA